MSRRWWSGRRRMRLPGPRWVYRYMVERSKEGRSGGCTSEWSVTSIRPSYRRARPRLVTLSSGWRRCLLHCSTNPHGDKPWHIRVIPCGGLVNVVAQGCVALHRQGSRQSQVCRMSRRVRRSYIYKAPIIYRTPSLKYTQSSKPQDSSSRKTN